MADIVLGLHRSGGVSAAAVALLHRGRRVRADTQRAHQTRRGYFTTCAARRCWSFFYLLYIRSSRRRGTIFTLIFTRPHSYRRPQTELFYNFCGYTQLCIFLSHIETWTLLLKRIQDVQLKGRYKGIPGSRDYDYNDDDDDDDDRKASIVWIFLTFCH